MTPSYVIAQGIAFRGTDNFIVLSSETSSKIINIEEGNVSAISLTFAGAKTLYQLVNDEQLLFVT